ncbi:MAG: hypothetical protein ABSH39_07725 [Candidatus Acidiferrum sp.]|jgi:hypothetical protein
MSAIGLVNLAQRLSNQGNPTSQETQSAQKTAPAEEKQGAQGLRQDSFTPSSLIGQGQTGAQAAGLFTAPQTTIFSPAATLLLQHQTAPQANQVSTAAQAAVGPDVSANTSVAQTANANVAAAAANATAAAAQVQTPAAANAETKTASAVNTQAAATTTPAIQPTTAQAVPVTTSSATSAAATTATPTSASAPATASTGTSAPATTGTTTAAADAATSSLAATQEQLQTLNLALAALGLNTQQIDQLDQVASIVNDYNPAAYTAQAFQLETLGQKAPAQTTSQAGAPQNANATPTTNNTAKAATAGTTANR